MKRTWIILGTVIGIPVLLIGLWIVHTSIYPFTSKDPNFADVDAAFSKLQFPADWQEISSTENKGIAGRGCDYFDSSGCFHKSKTFKIPETITVDDVKKVLQNVGCGTVNVTDNTKDGENEKSYSLRCTQGKINFAGSFRGPENEAYIVARTY